MACTACLVCFASTVSGGRKNALGRGSVSCGHITKLEQSTFLRYLCIFLLTYFNVCTATVAVLTVLTLATLANINQCKERVAVQNKSNFCWNLHDHHNNLQFTKIRNYLQKLLKVPNFAWLD
jgi:hypothetical protein